MKRDIPILTIITMIAAITAVLVISPLSVHSKSIALVGGTILDLSNFGNSESDIHNAVVLIEGDKIAAVGTRTAIEIPADAEVIDINGKYVLPGLIDGFGSLDNQAFANAYLYMGVTSIVGVYGMRRAPLFEKADPRPNIYRFGFVGKWKVSDSDLLKQIEEWADKGAKFLILQYELRPAQVKLAVDKAHELGIVAVGELGHTAYMEAMNYGVDAFIHSSRYCLDLAPPDLRKSVSANPFGPPARMYRRWLAALDPDEKSVIEYANALGSSKVALLPTLTLYCIDLPAMENPWEEPIAAIIDAKDIFMPLDPITGKHGFDPEIMELMVKGGKNTLRIERQFYKAGARYLAGSGTDVFGAMPGISLHQELKLLTTVGLSEREALAAATSNFSHIFKWTEIGQIEPGCRADILVVEKNPLENIKHLKAISLVMLSGTIIDREGLLKYSY